MCITVHILLILLSKMPPYVHLELLMPICLKWFTLYVHSAWLFIKHIRVYFYVCYRKPSVISIFSNFNLIFRQCRWELWGDFGHQSNFESLRKSRMETARNLSFIVWNGRGIFSFWRTNLCYEVWVMDIWWISGTYLCNKKLGSWFSTICVCISFCKVLVGISRNFSN